jgi:hypothetical protein
MGFCPRWVAWIYLLFSVAAGVGCALEADKAVIWSSVVLGWVSVNFLIAFGLYAVPGLSKHGPVIIRKNADGSLNCCAVLFFLPFFLFVWGFWRLRLLICSCCCGEKECWHLIRPDLFLGRRPVWRSEMPPNTTMVVDLTCEHWEPGFACNNSIHYICVPCLDMLAPEDAAVVPVLQAMKKHLQQNKGGIFVHCAHGKGRSAAVVGALLIQMGEVQDEAEAFRFMKAQRPIVKMGQAQMDSMRRLGCVVELAIPEGGLEGSI